MSRSMFRVHFDDDLVQARMCDTETQSLLLVDLKLTAAVSKARFLEVVSDTQYQGLMAMEGFTFSIGPARARTHQMLGVWAVNCGQAA